MDRFYCARPALSDPTLTTRGQQLLHGGLRARLRRRLHPATQMFAHQAFHREIDGKPRFLVSEAVSFVAGKEVVNLDTAPAQ